MGTHSDPAPAPPRTTRRLAQLVGALGSIGATAALARRLARGRDQGRHRRDSEVHTGTPAQDVEMLRAVMDGLPDAVLAVGADGRVCAASSASHRVLGLPADELIGHRVLHPSLRWTDEDGQVLDAADNPVTDAVAAGDALNTRLRLQRGEGAVSHMRVRVNPTPPGDRDPVAVVTITDVTEDEHARRSRASKEAIEHHRSLYDGLTGLPNRLMLMDRIGHARERAWRGATATAMVVIDLDGFQAINAVLGHEAGDEVLVQVALRLKTAMRATDTPCRVGGDDFVVLCEEISLDDTAGQVAAITTRVTDALDGPYLTTAGTTTVAASVGVAIADHPEQVTPALISRAESALQGVKEQQRVAGTDMPTIVSRAPSARRFDDEPISVVLVDADEAMRLLTRRVLLGSDHGFRIVGEAADGRDALQRIVDLRPDLVISDLLLGDMHASELVQEVRAAVPEQRFLLWMSPQEDGLGLVSGLADVPWLDKGQIDALDDAAVDAAASRLGGG